MKKTTILLFTVCCLLSISGCSLSTQEYNDEIVEVLDENGVAIEATVTAYNNSIPNLVTEESEIEVLSMQESLIVAEKKALKAEKLLSLESTNKAQQEEAQEELTTYIDTLQAYLTAYSEMIEYYNNTSYKENPNLVSDYDSELYNTDNLFDAFLESNNALAEILKSHI